MTPTPSTLTAWLLAARPKTLLASVAPVAIGTALAFSAGQFHAVSAAAALMGALAIQIGTNFANDYFDFLQGADTPARQGPTRAVAAGRITPRAMLAAMGWTFAAAAVVSVALIWRAGWPILVILILGILCGIFYTAGRHSLAYLGLADPLVLLFFGPVAVAGTYYVQALDLPRGVLWAGLGPGLLATGLLAVNNLRDIEEDRQSQKRTPAVRFGARFVRCEYTLCVVLAAAVPVTLAWRAEVPTAAAMAGLVLLPGLVVVYRVWTWSGRRLNACLGLTAALLLGYAVLFCLGCMVSLS